MKSGQIFWGTLFLTLGILFLLSNVAGLDIQSGSLFKFWPVILILAGVRTIIKDDRIKMALSGVNGLVVAVIIFSLFDWSRGAIARHYDHKVFDGPMVTSSSAPFDSTIKFVRLDFDGGAGNFRIRPDSLHLYSISSNRDSLFFNVDRKKVDSLYRLNVSMGSHEVSFGSDLEQIALDIKLNPAPVYDIRFNVGAASNDFDLSALTINNLEGDFGASSFDLKLGTPADSLTKVDLEYGASSLTILVPSKYGVIIRCDNPISSVDIQGFKSDEENTYTSDNFAKTKQNYVIDLNGGVSSLTVKRY